jgi:uncharacterized protein (DUF302 family)
MKSTNFFVGFIAGVGALALAMFKLAPKLMLKVHRSRLGFEETVTAVADEAKKRNWKVPNVYDIQNTLRDAGHEDMTRLKIVSICQPHHAHTILREDDNKFISAIMPCRVGVYENQQGDVYVAEMNMGLVSKLFGPTIRQVMGQVATEEHEMMSAIIDA